MKKKGGDTTLYSIIELVAAALVAYMAVNVATAYSQGTIYEKLNIAEDLAMQINELISMPADAYIVNKNIHGYSVYFAGNRIEVYQEVLDPIKGEYYYPKTENWNLDVRLSKPSQIVISKINGEIRISEEIPQWNAK